MKESIKEHILSSKDLLFDFVLFCCTNSGSMSSWRAILSGGPRIRKKNKQTVTMRDHFKKEKETELTVFQTFTCFSIGVRSELV